MLEQQHDKKDDVESTVLKMAETIKLNLNPGSIQRSHRPGKANVEQCKPLPIMVRFLSFRKRMIC